MPEQEPKLLLPYQLPTLGVAQQHVATLVQEASERSMLADRLAALEAEANELRLSLGHQPIKSSFLRFNTTSEQQDAHCARKNREQSKAIQALDGLDIPEDKPISIQREEYVDLDQAGGYSIYANTNVQRSGGLLFVEKNVSSTDRRNEGPWTTQYLVGRGLSRAMKVDGQSKQVVGRVFLLRLAGLCSWQEIEEVIGDVSEELATERLRTETIAILEDQPVVAGRYRDEHSQHKVITISDGQQLEVIARYYTDGHVRSLGELAIVEVLEGELEASARLNVERGEFTSYRKDDYSYNSNPKSDFKRALGVAKAMLAQGLK